MLEYFMVFTCLWCQKEIPPESNFCPFCHIMMRCPQCKYMHPQVAKILQPAQVAQREPDMKAINRLVALMQDQPLGTLSDEVCPRCRQHSLDIIWTSSHITISCDPCNIQYVGNIPPRDKLTAWFVNLFFK